MKILLTLGFCLFSIPSIAVIVKNVGEVPKALKSSLHRDHFKEGMSGNRLQKSALSCVEIVKLFGYQEDQKKQSEVECQTRSWSYEGKNVLLAALRREVDNKATLDVGIIDKQKKFKLLLRLEKSIDQVPIFEHVDKFDSTIFDLGVLGKAFGIRISKTGCGAGGSVCADGFLKLFRIDQGKLVQVFDGQMSYYGSFGGAWNKDGTRQHEVVEEIAILKIQKDSKHPKSPPKLIKNLKGKKTKIQTYTWDRESKVYRTKDPSILTSIE